MRINFAIRYRHPVDRVFPYLAEPERWHEYVDAVVERRRTSPGPPGVGSTWACVDRIGPWRFKFTEELVDIDPGRRVVWRQSAPWNSLMEFTCDPEPEGTRVTVDFDGKLSGWLRLLGIMPDSLATRTFARDFAKLETVLERS